MNSETEAKKIKELLSETQDKLVVDLERPDLAMLIRIIDIAEICGMTKRLLDVVRPFYNDEIPWVGSSKHEDEEVQEWIESLKSRNVVKHYR